MDNPKGGKQGGKGLDKEHEITNPQTGEKRTITQREWRDGGKELREQGWERPEGEEDQDVVEDEDTTEA
jgi:hypothetical protein